MHPYLDTAKSAGQAVGQSAVDAKVILILLLQKNIKYFPINQKHLF